MTNIKKYNHYTNTVTIKKYIKKYFLGHPRQRPFATADAPSSRQPRDAGKHRGQNHTDWSDTEDDFEHQTSLGAIVTGSIVL